MQIYWGEILERAHLTAVTGALRSRHWVSAVVAATEAENLLAFAAGFRGLLESAADTSTALGGIPGTLARDHTLVVRALSGELDSPLFIVTEIEDELIHFSYARHLSRSDHSTAPRSHKARHVRDYMNILERGQVTDVVACYRTLCDLTHPGAPSVWMWLEPVNELEIALSAHQDKSVISNFLKQYRTTLLELLMFAFNPAIVTLSVLNYFPIKKLHVPALLNWDLSRISLWRKCQDDLKGVRPQA